MPHIAIIIRPAIHFDLQPILAPAPPGALAARVCYSFAMSSIVSREWSFDEPDTTELVRFIGSRGEMWEPTPLLNPEHHHPLLDRTVSTPAASAHRLSAGLNKAGIRWPSFRTRGLNTRKH
jgi:hypothetical protein